MILGFFLVWVYTLESFRSFSLREGYALIAHAWAAFIA